MFLHQLYALKAISRNFQWLFSLNNFHQLYLCIREQVLGAPRATIPEVEKSLQFRCQNTINITCKYSVLPNEANQYTSVIKLSANLQIHLSFLISLFLLKRGWISCFAKWRLFSENTLQRYNSRIKNISKKLNFNVNMRTINDFSLGTILGVSYLAVKDNAKVLWVFFKSRLIIKDCLV